MAASRGDTVLELDRLSVAYYRAPVVRDLTLTVGRGEVVALLGANGAGKTTTLRAISGLLKPAGGAVRLCGQDLAGISPTARARLGLAHVPVQVSVPIAAVGIWAIIVRGFVSIAAGLIALRPGQHATGPEIIGFARERLAHYKCPSTVDVVDALPRNPSGKILKRTLRAPYWAGRDRQI